MASSIILTYNQNVQVGDILVIQDSLTPGQAITIPYEAIAQDSIVISNTIDETINSTSYFINDNYNNTNLYTVTVDLIGNTISILGNNNKTEFTVTSNNTSNRISTNIVNVAPPSVFEISTVTLSQAATEPCNNVKLTVTTNLQATNITSPISGPVTTNPYIFDTLRTGKITLGLNDANNSAVFGVFVPKLLSTDFNLVPILSPSANAITINNSYEKTPAFTLEYSLDNVNFFASNSFSGLTSGNHTVYIKDNIGCSVSIPFVIDQFTPNVVERKAFQLVSKLNSFRFKEIQDFTTNPKNTDNTLSFEEQVGINQRNYLQPFQTNDGTIKTQIKSNYTTNVATLIDCNNVSVNLPFVQQTNNRDITDLRDGLVKAIDYLGQSFISVRYQSGKTYDPVTLAENGDYNLGTSLPEWVNVGDYLNVQGAGWFRVNDIVISDNISTAVLSILESDFGLTIPAQGSTLRITSIYNQLEYDIYEFAVNLSNLSGVYKIKIDFQDSEFTNISYLSEWINVQTLHKNTHGINYYNTVNNDINYSTGIRNFVRYEWLRNLKYSPNDTQEVYASDTNTILLNATVRDNYNMNLRPLPTAMAQKVVLALSNDRVFIDGVSYIKSTESEFIPYGDTNLYGIIQQLTKANYVYDSGTTEGSIVITDGTPIEIDGNAQGLLFIN